MINLAQNVGVQLKAGAYLATEYEEPPLLQVQNLTKTYVNRKGLFIRRSVQAIKPLSFELYRGQTLAIVGEAGCGKSTLARMLAGMVEPSGGEILLSGQVMRYGDYSKRSKVLRMIFQDPETALNRWIRVGKILEMPLLINTSMSDKERAEKVARTLQLVGMQPEHAQMYPHMLSAGQQQRVGLARALVLDPLIVVGDDSLFKLDVSVRSQLINLLLELQESIGLSYVLAANDIGIVSHISDKVLVMQEGEVVERGKALQVFADPQHAVTRRLVADYNSEYRSAASV
ncbi:MAG: ATP-binding cassette domain-containing protein [Aeromonas sp.]